MDRHMKFSMFMFLGVVLIILAACTTKQVEQVAVKKYLKRGMS
ncbi:Uncharacterised protein [Streptococcus pneumoniae]|nr:Uncharacterised protein [Streptococcus pneumoniae]